MKTIKGLLFLVISLFLLTSTVEVNATTIKHFMDTTEEVQIAERKIHMTFKKVIPEALQNVQANIEVLNNKNRKIATFNGVTIGEEGEISDSRIYQFDSALDSSFFSSVMNPTLTKKENLKKITSELPALGESDQFILSSGILLLITVSGIYLVSRKRRKGKWLLLIILIGGASRVLPTSTAFALDTPNYDLSQYEVYTDAQYTIKLTLTANYKMDNDVTPPLESNQSSLTVHDSILYVGDSWNAKDNFDNAKDQSGKLVDFGKITVNGKVDTSTVGDYTVSYRYQGIKKDAHITVKANQSSLTVHDSTLYVGDHWKAEDNFVSATDKEGKNLDFSYISVEGIVDTSKASTYEIVYSYQNKIAKAKVTVEEKNMPINNGDGTVDFMNQTWDIMKDYGNGNVMIAGLEAIKPEGLPFVRFNSTGYYYQEDNDQLNGYDESLPKILLDDWYNKNVLGTSVEKYIQPVTPLNPILSKMKQLGWTSNTMGDQGNDPVKRQLWRDEIMAPDKYPTLVGTGKKQAFLMSASDVVKNTDQVGHFTDEASKHLVNLTNKGVSEVYLRTPGENVKATLMLSKTFPNFIASNFIESAGASTIPTLVVNIP
ncbi:bacterial Ig-like domain-containing protein [Lactococcus petauri]|uniref:bacterial Ig-like domain-containing protein n=1 Tax=Lactococcus petauri TaxID=1940789 RepID=UPI00177C2058|nr:bacterial Ig-like domain-containing protein [Lactococcus petauri]MBD5824720.1 hypothetical protein [Lactococcus petauri]